MKIGAEYESTSWKSWGEERSATAVPGCVEFLQYAKSKGVKSFFITNRKDDLRNATYGNLLKVGITTTLDHVITRNDEDGRAGDKLSRRATVAAGHRIVLLVGDNFADLTARDRHEFKADPKLHDGWIMLPNPVYGHWETRPSAATSPAEFNSVMTPVPPISQPIYSRSAVHCAQRPVHCQPLRQSPSACNCRCYCHPRH